MKTQISIQVKNENWLSRCMSLFGLIGLFTKANVSMYIDDPECQRQPTVLQARKEPYLIDMAPGGHVVTFTAKNRSTIDKFIGGAMLGMIGMGAGGGFGALVGAKAGSDFVAGLMGHTRVQDNLIECNLEDGDLLKIQIKPKRNGSVKIKVLNK